MPFGLFGVRSFHLSPHLRAFAAYGRRLLHQHHGFVFVTIYQNEKSGKLQKNGDFACMEYRAHRRRCDTFRQSVTKWKTNFARNCEKLQVNHAKLRKMAQMERKLAQSRRDKNPPTRRNECSAGGCGGAGSSAMVAAGGIVMGTPCCQRARFCGCWLLPCRFIQFGMCVVHLVVLR